MAISIDCRSTQIVQKFVFVFVLINFYFSAAISQELKRPGAQSTRALVHLDTLENGLRMVTIEDSLSNRVFWSIQLETPHSLELERAGVARFTGETMRSGTESLSADSLDALLESYDAEILTAQGALRASSPKEHAQETLGLLASVLRSPAFTEMSVSKAIERYRLAISANAQDSKSRAHQLSKQQVFTKKHPYGEAITSSSLDSISRLDLIHHHAVHYRPQYAGIAVIGDVAHEETLTWVQAVLGDWLPREIPFVRHSLPIKPLQNRICFGEVSGEQRIALVLSHAVKLKPGHSDEAACVVLNAILTHPRLPGVIIDSMCFTPPCSPLLTSELIADPLLGHFRIQSVEAPDDVIPFIERSLTSMRKLTRERVDINVVQMAIEHVIAEMHLQDPEKHMDAWLDAILKRENPEGPQAFLKALQTVNPSDIQRVAIHYLRPSNLIIAISGDRSRLPKNLDRFCGDSEIEFFDSLGNRILQLDPAPIGETAESVFQDYYNACGGVEGFESLGSLIQNGHMNAGSGMEFDLEIKTKYGLGQLTQVSMNGKVMMEQILTASKGVNRLNGEVKALSEAEYLRLKQSLYPAHFLHLNDLNLTAELLGMDRAADGPHYVVDIRFQGEPRETLYFHHQSHLLVKSVGERKGPTGPVKFATAYSDFEMFQGLAFPMTIVQTTNGQSMTLSLNEVLTNGRVPSNLFDLK